MKGIRVAFAETVQAGGQDFWEQLESTTNQWLEAHPDADVQDIKIVNGWSGMVRPLILFKPAPVKAKRTFKY